MICIVESSTWLAEHELKAGSRSFIRPNLMFTFITRASIGTLSFLWVGAILLGGTFSMHPSQVTHHPGMFRLPALLR